MKQLLYICLFVLMIWPVLLYAQDNKISLMVSGYASLPNGDYGKTLGQEAKQTRRYGFDIGNNVGLAEPGFGIGFEFNTHMLTDGLGWIVSSRYLMNGTDPTAAQSVYNRAMGDSMNVIVESGTWHHFPFLTGFRYSFDLSESFALTAMIQGGVNFSMAPSRKVSVNGIVGEETSFQVARDFGYEFGVGVEFLKQWNLEVSYSSLGTPRYEGTRKLSEKVFPEIIDRKNAILGEERSISMILIRLGYYLF